MVLVRTGLALVAVVICAWFALGVRQARDTDRASAAVAIASGGAKPTPAQRRRASALLHDAKLLNPDTQVDVLRAELDLGERDQIAARKGLEYVVAKEPQNALAWEWLARASVGDPGEFFVAAVRVRQLVPNRSTALD